MTFDRIAIIGAGTMGHGIAQLFAQVGFPVALADQDPAVLQGAFRRIRGNLETCLKGSPAEGDLMASVLERIALASNLAGAASQADFVVEAVVEDLELKRSILRQLEECCSSRTVIASTTSGYCVRDMAGALRHPERFLVTHFWNPPYLIPGVEVMPGELTSAETVESTFALLESAGKRPVLVRKDVPGFIGNRLQHALRREAIAIVAGGIASAADVDLIARLSFGLRLPFVGPLQTADLGGLDLTLAIQSYLLPELDRSTEAQQLIQDKVARGELGAKAGKGFYDWPPGQRTEVIRQRDEALLELLRWLETHAFLEMPSGD